MEYAVFKMKFKGLLHIGVSSLEDCGISICADTLFSALAVETLKSGGQEAIDAFVDSVRNGDLVFSDAFPYIGGACFVRKPVFRKPGPARSVTDAESASGEKKKFKKLQYVPIDAVDAYFAGDFSPDDTLRKFSHCLGRSAVQTKAAVRRSGETLPYRVGVFGFAKDAGLYVMAGGKTEGIALFEELMRGLADCGIGGKRSAGMGRFELRRDELAGGMAKRLSVFSKGEESDASGLHVTLSPSLPRDDELDAAMEGAFFSLSRRGGFVYSETYADAPQRKNDLYVFDAGSVFTRKFAGDVYDVSNRGAHPVYRYAKPLFLGVNP
ncbi:MAG: type III-A CRISPR-associated RAMP protein Csm4 [Clostridiales Family XIII bacterium]|nr:type III-A CRISPR-associated RAMP protein Csm4 [Clostridiales Family XIII bacterium]